MGWTGAKWKWRMTHLDWVEMEFMNGIKSGKARHCVYIFLTSESEAIQIPHRMIIKI